MCVCVCVLTKLTTMKINSQKNLEKYLENCPNPSNLHTTTEIGGILPPTKSLLWRTFLFSPSGSATTIHNSSQYLALMQLISKTISHKPGHLSFPILLK